MWGTDQPNHSLLQPVGVAFPGVRISRGSPNRQRSPPCFASCLETLSAGRELIPLPGIMTYSKQYRHAQCLPEPPPAQVSPSSLSLAPVVGEVEPRLVRLPVPSTHELALRVVPPPYPPPAEAAAALGPPRPWEHTLSHRTPGWNALSARRASHPPLPPLPRSAVRGGYPDPFFHPAFCGGAYLARGVRGQSGPMSIPHPVSTVLTPEHARQSPSVPTSPVQQSSLARPVDAQPSYYEHCPLREAPGTKYTAARRAGQHSSLVLPL